MFGSVLYKSLSRPRILQEENNNTLSFLCREIMVIDFQILTHGFWSFQKTFQKLPSLSLFPFWLLLLGLGVFDSSPPFQFFLLTSLLLYFFLSFSILFFLLFRIIVIRRDLWGWNHVATICAGTVFDQDVRVGGWSRDERGDIVEWHWEHICCLETCGIFQGFAS